MNNPYAAPAAELQVDQSGQEEYQPKIFALHGRIGRLRYLAYGLLFSVVGMTIAGVLLGGLVLVGGKGMSTWFPTMMTIALYAIGIIPAKRRLNDLDHSGWFALLAVVPIVNGFLGLYLMFGRGTDSRNQFGARPCDNPRGIIWAALALPMVAVLGIVAAIAIPAYQDYVHKAQTHATTR